MKILSINIGKKTDIKWRGKIYHTGIYKSAIEGPVILGAEDVEHDIVIDRKHHGGIDQAVYAYGWNHYDYWRTLYPGLNLDFGFFGENLTVSYLDEENIHVGDIYTLGETLIQVTKPRQPCFKLGIRFGSPEVISQFWNSTKSGVYFKVLKTGSVNINDEFKLLEKALNSSSIAQVFLSKKP
jgi:MOSC domain-containing protein YiiM